MSTNMHKKKLRRTANWLWPSQRTNEWHDQYPNERIVYSKSDTIILQSKRHLNDSILVINEVIFLSLYFTSTDNGALLIIAKLVYLSPNSSLSCILLIFIYFLLQWMHIALIFYIEFWCRGRLLVEIIGGVNDIVIDIAYFTEIFSGKCEVCHQFVKL